MIPEPAAIWLEGYKAGARDADKDHALSKQGDFLRFDELEPNPYGATK